MIDKRVDAVQVRVARFDKLVKEQVATAIRREIWVSFVIRIRIPNQNIIFFMINTVQVCERLVIGDKRGK